MSISNLQTYPVEKFYNGSVDLLWFFYRYDMSGFRDVDPASFCNGRFHKITVFRRRHLVFLSRYHENG